MGLTFHLSLQPQGLEGAVTFTATLRQAGSPDAATRVLILPAHLRELALGLAQGRIDSLAAESIRGANALLALLTSGGEGDPFRELANLMVGTEGSRLVVHVLPGLADADRKLIEHLPWAALDHATTGHLTVVLSTAPVDQALRTGRTHIAARTSATEPMRVLVVVGSLEQHWYDDAGANFARDSIAALRDGLHEATGTDAKHPRIEVRVVAPKRQLAALTVPGLGAMPLESIDELREALRGKRSVAGVRGFHVIHFVGHSDASALKPATRLLCGFQPLAASLAAHPPEDCLKAEDLAADLRQAATNQRTALCVFENCHVGSEFIRHLDAVEHAIGTQGLLPVQLGRLWTAAFYGHLAGFTPIGEALREARRAIADCKIPALEDRWFQLTHWTTCDVDQPFGTFAGWMLLQYAHHVRGQLQQLEGGFQGHRLRGIAIPLSIEHFAAGTTPQEQDERDLRLRHRGDGGDLTLRLLVDTGGAYFLLGEPGGGKTVSEQDTVLRLLDALHLDSLDGADAAATDTDPRKIPIYVRLPDWVRSHGRTPSLENVIAFCLANTPLEQRHQTALCAWLLRQRRRLCIFLDGWDEIPGKRDDRDPDLLSPAKELVTALVDPAQAPHALVVACRFAARPEPFARVTELRVRRLEPHHQVDLLEGWLRTGDAPTPDSRDRAESIVATLQKQPGSLRQLVTIPLYLGLLGRVVAEQPAQDLAPLLAQIQHRHAFFRHVLEVLLTNAHRRGAARKPGERRPNLTEAHRHQLQILRELAFRMLCQGRLEIVKEDLDAELQEMDPQQLPTLIDAFELAGLLRPVARARRDGNWAFQHRSLLEALAAQHLAALDLPPSKRQAERAKRQQLAAEAVRARAPTKGGTSKDDTDPAKFWVEPFALTAGYLEGDGPAWIQWLLSQSQLKAIGLAAVALADSKHVEPRLVRDVLEQNQSANWRERRTVLESLLPPFGAGASQEMRAELLQYVQRERTSKGKWRIDRSELWFVDQVFAQVAADGTQPADVRREAAEQRDALMRHIGVEALPKAIAAMLEDRPTSVLAGRDSNSYWRFVPRGDGWLGSQDEEEGRWGDRETLTPFRIAQPFWMAEVHVTAKLWGLFSGGTTACSRRDAQRSAPARSMDWYQATMFARWLTVRLHDAGGPADLEIRLPMEWEWEYAARWYNEMPSQDLQRMRPPFGWAMVGGQVEAVTRNNLDRLLGEERDEPGDCGAPTRHANPLGLRDMMRFLWTWCSTAYGPYRPSEIAEIHEPSSEPPVAATEHSDAPRVLRGGGYGDGAVNCRAADRGESVRGWSDVGGVRLVCVRVSPQLDARRIDP